MSPSGPRPFRLADALLDHLEGVEPGEWVKRYAAGLLSSCSALAQSLAQSSRSVRRLGLAVRAGDDLRREVARATAEFSAAVPPGPRPGKVSRRELQRRLAAAGIMAARIARASEAHRDALDPLREPPKTGPRERLHQLLEELRNARSRP